jgi:hypothetical protein
MNISEQIVVSSWMNHAKSMAVADAPVEPECWIVQNPLERVVQFDLRSS